jgi:hypothetical protein
VGGNASLREGAAGGNYCCCDGNKKEELNSIFHGNLAVLVSKRSTSVTERQG